MLRQLSLQQSMSLRERRWAYNSHIMVVLHSTGGNSMLLRILAQATCLCCSTHWCTHTKQPCIRVWVFSGTCTAQGVGPARACDRIATMHCRNWPAVQQVACMTMSWDKAAHHQQTPVPTNYGPCGDCLFVWCFCALNTTGRNIAGGGQASCIFSLCITRSPPVQGSITALSHLFGTCAVGKQSAGRALADPPVTTCVADGAVHD